MNVASSDSVSSRLLGLRSLSAMAAEKSTTRTRARNDAFADDEWRVDGDGCFALLLLLEAGGDEEAGLVLGHLLPRALEGLQPCRLDAYVYLACIAQRFGIEGEGGAGWLAG